MLSPNGLHALTRLAFWPVFATGCAAIPGSSEGVFALRHTGFLDYGLVCTMSRRRVRKAATQITGAGAWLAARARLMDLSEAQC